MKEGKVRNDSVQRSMEPPRTPASAHVRFVCVSKALCLHKLLEQSKHMHFSILQAKPIMVKVCSQPIHLHMIAVRSTDGSELTHLYTEPSVFSLQGREKLLHCALRL